MKKPLADFNYRTLCNIIESFGKKSRIFNNEAQFQFELAWKINEVFNCRVKLEEICRIDEINGKKKKDYTDIILEDKNETIAIELKYKTAFLVSQDEATKEDKYPNGNFKHYVINDTSIKKIFLKSHGAADLGAYDFMWDIHRLQRLVGIDKTTKENDIVRTKCNRGYAVILTNDSTYWKKKPQAPKTINHQFLIGEDFDQCNFKGTLAPNEHTWMVKKGNNWKKGTPYAITNSCKYRAKSISMSKTYNYVWNNYFQHPLANKNGDFKYMTVEIIT